MSHTPPAPREPLRLDLEDVRSWLLEQIDGGEEVKGHDSMLSTYINTIDNALAALSSEMGTIPAAETPITQALVSMLEAGWLSLGSSAPGAVRPLVEALEVFERENADLKQRLLPQYLGRAERAEKARQMAEHERDAMLEQLIEARSATGEPVAWMYEESGERMFGHPDGYRPLGAVPLYAGSPPVEEKAIGHALNTLDIIANWGDEENEWDAVVKYRSVRDRAATHVAILRSPMKGEKP